MAENNNEQKEEQASHQPSQKQPAATQPMDQSAETGAREIKLADLKSLLKVEIIEDGYAAQATILALAENAVVSPNMVHQFLKTQKVAYGVEEEILEKVADALVRGPAKRLIRIAEGKRVKEGKDGSVTYNFRTKLEAGKVEEGNNIDFKERGLINNVKEGDVLAVVTPEVHGTPGKRVNGAVIDPKPIVLARRPRLGGNVDVSEDGNTFTARLDGHASLMFQEISVSPDFVIRGDLDYTKGNIDFIGNVHVHGTVKSGFTIKAGGHVIVNGDIEHGAAIEAGKDITVKGTIRCGKKEGKVDAGGTVTALRMSNSLVKAQEHVMVKEEVAECDIRCYGKFATAKAGIHGCVIEAVSGIYADSIGLKGKNATNTLYAGLTVSTYERLQKIEEELEKIKEEQALLYKGYSSKLGKGTRDTEFETLEVDEQDRVKRMSAAYSKQTKVLKDRQEELEAERDELTPLVRQDDEAVVEIKKFIYPTCHIRIGEREIEVLEQPLPGKAIEQSAPAGPTI